jgi:hypothetical protein
MPLARITGVGVQPVTDGLLYALTTVAVPAWIGAMLLMKAGERHFAAMVAAAQRIGSTDRR